MKFSLIGNCAYQALIDEQAAIQWLCWPRFDSSFVFGGLLDDTRGGEFSITPGRGAYQTSQRYLDNTNIVRTEFETADGAFEVVDFAPRFLQFERSFKPSMLVRRIRARAGSPSVRVRCRPVYDYGLLEPSCYTASHHIQWMIPGAQLRLTTNAPLTYVVNGAPFALDEDIYLVLTWGQPLEAPLRDTCESFLGRTRRYWETWVKHCTIPEKFQAEVIRSALALKLHQFEDTGAITAATTSSVAEHPGSGRTWDYRYCWLRDSCFTVGALRRLGHFEELEGFVRYLDNIAERSPGHLQPVYGIDGAQRLDERLLPHLRGYRGEGPVRAGNQAYEQVQHDVYGEMLAAIAPMFLDLRFQDHDRARSTALLHSLVGSIERLVDAPDAGLWEKRASPRLHAFTVLMHWTGARVARTIGRRRDDEALVARAEALIERASTLLEERMWRPDAGFFAEADEGDDADASLLMMVNLGYLRPGDPRAARHVDELARRLAARPHLLHRYRHHDGIGETHATFTICSFWYAEALARLGRQDEAEDVFRALVGHANHVGLLSEDIDPDTGAQWGNFPQAYSHVGVINAAFCISPVSEPIV